MDELYLGSYACDWHVRRDAANHIARRTEMCHPHLLPVVQFQCEIVREVELRDKPQWTRADDYPRHHRHVVVSLRVFVPLQTDSRAGL